MEISDYINILWKLSLWLISLIFVINLTWKWNLAPNSASEQIQNYVLWWIIWWVIYLKNIDIFQFLIILIIWTSLVYSLRLLKTKNSNIKNLIDGKPVVIIDNWKVDVEACKKVSLTANDLTFKLRTHNVYNVHEVKKAIIEQNWQLLIVLKWEEKPKYPLITDWTIQTSTLELLKKDEQWLKDELKKYDWKDFSNVFLAEYDNWKIHITFYK